MVVVDLVLVVFIFDSGRYFINGFEYYLFVEGKGFLLVVVRNDNEFWVIDMIGVLLMKKISL